MPVQLLNTGGANPTLEGQAVAEGPLTSGYGRDYERMQCQVRRQQRLLVLLRTFLCGIMPTHTCRKLPTRPKLSDPSRVRCSVVSRLKLRLLCPGEGCKVPQVRQSVLMFL